MEVRLERWKFCRGKEVNWDVNRNVTKFGVWDMSSVNADGSIITSNFSVSRACNGTPENGHLDSVSVKVDVKLSDHKEGDWMQSIREVTVERDTDWSPSCSH